MTNTSEEKFHSSKPKFAITLLAHQFIGTVGVLILAGMLTNIVFEFPNLWGRTATMHDVAGALTGTPYFPVQIIVGLLLGWLVSDLFGHESMIWIWVLPCAYLVYDFARLPAVLGLTFQARFSYFFGWGCRPENHCIDQTGVTLPFYAAVAYSVGALLARKIPMRDSAVRRKISALVFTAGVLVLADEAVGIVFHRKSLLGRVPQGWGWILLPALILGTGIGLCLILAALKFRGIRRRTFKAREAGSS